MKCIMLIIMCIVSTEVCWYWEPLALQSRSELEQQSIEAASTSDAVTFITYVQSLKRKMKAWEKQVNLPNTWLTFHITVDISQGLRFHVNCLLGNVEWEKNIVLWVAAVHFRETLTFQRSVVSTMRISRSTCRMVVLVANGKSSWSKKDIFL